MPLDLSRRAAPFVFNGVAAQDESCNPERDVTHPTRPQTEPSPPRQQLDRSNDPAVTRSLDADAPAEAMRSDRDAFVGSASGVGSVGYDEAGAFDVGSITAPNGDDVDNELSGSAGEEQKP